MPRLKYFNTETNQWESISTNGAPGKDGVSPTIDNTLTQSGQAADAKAVGDALAQKQPLGNYLTEIPGEYVTESEMQNYAQPKGSYLTSIPSEYVTETELSEKGYLTSYTETDPTVPSWAKEATKPSYTKSEIGLGNVENVKQYSSSNPPPYPVTSINSKTGAVTLTATDVGARPNTWTPTASDVGAMPVSTIIPSKTSQLTNDSGFLSSYTETDPTVPSWAKASAKPSYTKSEVGLGNVDNVRQYSINNPPPYPVTSVNGETGAITIDAVRYTAQTLSEAQKAQARENIGITDTGINNIPDYWQIALDEGVDAINEAMENAGRNKSSFLWYHDAHWPDNSRQAPILLKYLQDHTAINKVNYGGDIINTETAESRDDWDYVYEWRDAVRGLKNHHSVLGNHDNDIPGLNTDKAIYAYLMASEETPDIVRGGDFYYYIDDVNEKTRYIYLDTSMCTTLTNQGNPLAVQFLVEALKSTPEKWHIVPISHIWFLYDDYNTPKVGQIPDYCQQLFDVFDAYNEKSSSSVTVNGTVVSYDFTSAVGKVEFCIGGHTHVDMDFTTNGGIPVILTEADKYETRGGYSCAPGTIGESAVDGIIADYDAKKISVIRVGRGESRVVSIGKGATNALAKSIASTGEIFNGGKGWADKSRIGSSKVLEGYIGSGNYYVSGYIKIDPTVNTTVRMRNISFDSTRTSDIGLAFFGENFMRVPFGSASSNDDYIMPNRFVVENMNLSTVLDGTNIVEFTLKTSQHLYSGIKYIAICADYIGDDSIITINEPID